MCMTDTWCFVWGLFIIYSVGVWTILERKTVRENVKSCFVTLHDWGEKCCRKKNENMSLKKSKVVLHWLKKRK